MADIQEPDISWLHHLQKDQHAHSAASTTSSGAVAASKSNVATIQPPKSGSRQQEASLSKANGGSTTQNSHHTTKPQLSSRQSSDRLAPPAQSSPKNPKDPKSLPLPSPTRRGSWISSISSKFSSSGNSPTPTSNITPTAKPQPSPQVEHTNPIEMTSGKEAKKSDTSTSPSQQSPKSGSSSFIHNALRRLSSSSGGMAMGKMGGSNGICQRRVMNINPYRERCEIEELQPAKLRRVAFCVDIEIAGTARYVEEEETPDPTATGQPLDPQVSDKQAQTHKVKEKKIKERSEGEALKSPKAVTEAKDKVGPDLLDKEAGDIAIAAAPPTIEKTANGDAKEHSRKKEKKKRSEEERKERKERKKQEAVENGTVPVELSREPSNAENSTGTSTPSKTHDRPTTDPLRIYRRCCQLRQTSILKKITDQLSSSSACDPTSPGTILCLDFSDNSMELQDIVTLGDYLAVVPVKKLILENCGLTDEAIRVILAGLLAAKTPEQAKYNKRLAKKLNTLSGSDGEKLGVIEKLSLKNNPKLGRDAWRHIGLFIYMSRSLKAIDLSMIPFPQPMPSSIGAAALIRSPNAAKATTSMSTTFQKAVASRLAGAHFEELVMAECGLTTEDIMKIVDAVMESGATRLGLASNNISSEALEHIARYIQTGKCGGLDLGGNDLSDHLGILATALDGNSPLFALSLADCNLSPLSLRPILPALVSLSNFRFLDLSHNRNLFVTQPNALSLLRKYLPQMHNLRRVHLNDVALAPDHAIALAEVLPECPTLAHLNILENPLITTLASAKDEATQEEACALYASLMAAVRVSETIVSIEVDIPKEESSEIVKALAKQVDAYSLRNMERGPMAEAYASSGSSMTDSHIIEKPVAVPDILLHIVGHVEGAPGSIPDNEEPAPDDDYIVGGTGVVKALGVCLGNRAADHRRLSRDDTPDGSGTATPVKSLSGTEIVKSKSKTMSLDLLGSARKIRARLQPAMACEARDGNEAAYKRLQFLDSTLERMIQRFEDEFPECRIKPPAPSLTKETTSDSGTSLSSFTNPFDPEDKLAITGDMSDDEVGVVKNAISRHNSETSLASRHLVQEEGRMHRFGQKLRRDILRPQTLDYAHGTTGSEEEAQHLQRLRVRLEALGGDEIKERVEKFGPEAILKHIGTSAEELLRLEQEDPEAFEKFKVTSLTTWRNIEDNARDQEEAVA